MKPEIKKLWLEALRSGEYAQAADSLHYSDGTYCCLGVLCELHRQQTNTGRWERSAIGSLAYWERSAIGSLAYIANEYDSSEQSLPPPVQEWAGLEYSDPVVKGATLSAWNDGRNGPQLYFPAIADLIEGWL